MFHLIPRWLRRRISAPLDSMFDRIDENLGHLDPPDDDRPDSRERRSDTALAA